MLISPLQLSDTRHMSGAFSVIGVIGKFGKSNVAEVLSAYLQKRSVEVIVDDSASAAFSDSPFRFSNSDTIADQCDLAIVVGGDGTLLNAARSLAESGVSVLGINLGRLGFLVDVSPSRMVKQLDHVFCGEFTEEERSLLQTTVIRNGAQIMESAALNDVVVHKWDIARMIELDTYINGQFLNTSRSDGLIVTTPTGTTANALSGGGPILHPGLNAIALVTICPHTLSNRPIVVGDAAEIEIIVKDEGGTEAQITCDGQVNLPLLSSDCINIRKKAHKLRLIHPPGYNYYEILRAKLRWSEHP